MLGAHRLAAAAADAVGGFAALGGEDLVIIEILVPVVEGALEIVAGEQVGDLDALGAGVLIDAVAAAGAGNEPLGLEHAANPVDGDALGIIQGAEVGHGGDIVLHLGHAAHAGQHHADVGEAGGETDGIAGIGAAVKTIEHSLGLGGQLHQMAALDGLHHQDGLAVLDADVVALLALHGGAVVVHIVELKLHHVQLGVSGENLVQHLRLIVEGDTHMAQLALRLHGESGLIGPAALELLKVAAVLGVHQIEVEIIHAADVQLGQDEGAHVGLGLEVGIGELVGEQILAAVIARGEALAEYLLALAAVVAVGGVEVVEAGAEEGVHHLLHLGDIDFAVGHGEAHAAEAEIAVDLREEGIGFHRITSFILWSAPRRCGLERGVSKGRFSRRERGFLPRGSRCGQM